MMTTRSCIALSGADADRAVGDVEAWEVPAAVMHLDEVDDPAVPDAVDHVADRTAEDEREGPAEQTLAAVVPQHPDNEDRRRGAEADEEPALPARRAGEKRKRRSGVVYANQVEERSDGSAVTELECADHEQLGQLVEQDDDQRDG
jgi:hypothetical protein